MTNMSRAGKIADLTKKIKHMERQIAYLKAQITKHKRRRAALRAHQKRKK